ncbi:MULTISPECIES: acyl-CoA ligase (AMP-forming), exosortase A system-associated [Nitrosomonas]|uniref:Acyl--CoA ligase n=1 Tax=Nitrosomonas communis TaxID=44574 RepID=A0A0F7KAY4_9PROT|nr:MULTISPECIES: acyl-CoA ligase (AMP-forming), exosortase A system-associated [Nitrosomonas]AKH37525.1 acyl--CoA ligase [Nitrosomonas communis]TYP92365.1 acyl-CoA ligase (AMP-forming) (exosortase A-associated) [Nitrosomonas communis]UVS62777.1 acyl-CoA ligase (AMP-forming), exosortase A system-associated [Nitrosomonas sp. PLL12]
MPHLFHELVFNSANDGVTTEALVYQHLRLDYAALAQEIQLAANALLALGLGREERLAIYLEKRFEAVIAIFAASTAGGVFVPINPLLKAAQVAYILKDCNVRILVTSVDRLNLLISVLPECHDLHTVIVVGPTEHLPVITGVHIICWQEAMTLPGSIRSYRCIDSDMAAILYTSGSTGKPKGVVLSHRNLVTGAKSVSQYLKNNQDDRILSVLPLSFDYGLSQLSTAFYVGATNVLMNYLLPRDIIHEVIRESITGLAAVPSLWIQLAQLKWEKVITLRYLTNSGGAMPQATLNKLRCALPNTSIFLMYGLTEAFRSTFLPPEEADKRPSSIGKAIPNVEVLVLREDGSQCAPGEPGELVHRGPLVSMGYWNDTEKTTKSFRPLLRHSGLTMPEIAVWSGDTVRMDEEGYLYFIGRCDDMIKTSGYRVSPTEIEEIIYSTECVAEAAAIGVPHPTLGQAIIVVVVPLEGVNLDTDALLLACRRDLPAFMVPSLIKLRQGHLLRNPNGKIDRKSIAQEFLDIFISVEI